jgi:hypothetical protein
MDPATTHDKATETPLLQTYSPFSSNPGVLNTSGYTTQHSKGLLTPCRQVGLRRKSPRNIISPSSSDGEPSASPINVRFVFGQFSSPVLDKHLLDEKEMSKSLGKRLKLENLNEKTKHCRYERQKEPIQHKCEETNNCTVNCNESQQSDRGIFKDSDTQNKSDAYIMISSGNSDREKAIRKTKLENMYDKTEKCSAETPCCKNLDFQTSSLSYAHSIIISEHRSDERVADKAQIVHVDDHTNNLGFQSNSNNENKIVYSEDITEFTEENLKMLKQQITIKEEEVKRLKLILMYKKKVIDDALQSSFPHFCVKCRVFSLRFCIFPLRSICLYVCVCVWQLL